MSSSPGKNPRLSTKRSKNAGAAIIAIVRESDARMSHAMTETTAVTLLCFETRGITPISAANNTDAPEVALPGTLHGHPLLTDPGRARLS